MSKPARFSSRHTSSRGSASSRVAASERLIPKLDIDGLSHDGRGVGRDRGRVVFVDGGVPGDCLQARISKRTSKLTEAVASKIIEPSSHRVEPACPWFGRCGGCRLQHINSDSLLNFKQDIVLGQLRRIARLEPEQLLPALTSPAWGYRSRARLAVRWWNKKLQFGFRATGSQEIVPVDSCAVLTPALSALLPQLRECLQQSVNKKAVSHIELAAADNGHGVLLRTLQPLTDEDRARWLQLAQDQGLHLYLQPESSADSLICLHGPDGQDALRYALAEQNIVLDYLPVDFTQVNAGVNQQMISRALEWLELKPQDRVLDLFCGMGNFTLPLARHCAHVVGVEGVDELVARGQHNARLNQIDNVSFVRADLAAEPGARSWAEQHYDALLLDPPRTGALEILQQLAGRLPDRILYVSCHSATLARDAGLLRELGYGLQRFSVMDMFPQTTHVESMGLFCRG